MGLGSRIEYSSINSRISTSSNNAIVRKYNTSGFTALLPKIGQSCAMHCACSGKAIRKAVREKAFQLCLQAE